MTEQAVDRYLTSLRREMAGRGAAGADRFVEEAHAHLLDAVESGERRGLTRAQAEREACARFGEPRAVAAAFAAEYLRRRHRAVLTIAIIAGIAIACVDSRPGWDDTGITAFALLTAAGLLGLFAPERPWRWALGIGAWIPLYLVAKTPTVGTAAGSLLILGFPLAGAYLGMLLRRALSSSNAAAS